MVTKLISIDPERIGIEERIKLGYGISLCVWGNKKKLWMHWERGGTGKEGSSGGVIGPNYRARFDIK